MGTIPLLGSLGDSDCVIVEYGDSDPSKDVLKSFKNQPRGKDGRWIDMVEISMASVDKDPAKRMANAVLLILRSDGEENRKKMAQSLAATGMRKDEVIAAYKKARDIVESEEASAPQVVSEDVESGRLTIDEVDQEVVEILKDPKSSDSEVEFADKKTRRLAEEFDLSAEDIASVSGAPDGSSVRVSSDNEGALIVDIKHDSITDMQRRIYRDGDDKVMHNEVLILNEDEQGSGLGFEVFMNQVANCRKHGFTCIETNAVRRDDGPKKYRMWGHYAWPRMGYGGRIDSIRSLPIREEVKRLFPEAKDVRDLMATRESREWWKRNGMSLFNVVFDLSDGSRSLRMLAAYRIAKMGVAA